MYATQTETVSLVKSYALPAWVAVTSVGRDYLDQYFRAVHSTHAVEYVKRVSLVKAYTIESLRAEWRNERRERSERSVRALAVLLGRTTVDYVKRPRVSLVKAYVSPLGTDLRNGIFPTAIARSVQCDTQDRALTERAYQLAARRYSFRITEWSLTGVQPADLSAARTRLLLTEFLRAS